MTDRVVTERIVFLMFAVIVAVVVAVSVVAHVPTGPKFIPRKMAVFVSIVIFKHVFCGNMVFMFFHHVDECTKFAEVEQCITVNI